MPWKWEQGLLWLGGSCQSPWAEPTLKALPPRGPLWLLGCLFEAEVVTPLGPSPPSDAFLLP